MITQINIVKEPEYYYPAGLAEKNGLMTYQEFQKLDSIPTPSNIVTKSSTAGLLKNDGTVDTNSYVKKSDIELEKTATGNPITLTDAVAGNAIEVSAEIVASQDLHGYDKPWVGGAGKNMIPMTVESIKAANTEGTWSGNDYTFNGVKFTILTDSANNIIGISADGITSANHVMLKLGQLTLQGGIGYTLTGCPSGGSLNGYRLSNFGSNTVDVSDLGSGATITVSNDESYTFMIYVKNSGTVLSDITFYPMLRLSTVTDASFAPYSNICPISGHSTVTITDVDSESHTATVTVALGSTVYGGTLDLTSGELTITHGFITLDGTQEIIIANWKPKDNSIGWLYRYSLTNAKVLNADEVGDIISDSLTADTYQHLFNNDVTGITFYTDTSYGLVVRVADTSLTTSALINAYLASNPIQICYELAAPTTTTLTAEQLALVKGYNYLACNSGDMEITYKASGLDALKERVDELEDAVADLETDLASKTENSVVGTVENGTTASQPYAVGEHFIRNDKFCTAIASIASGATLTLNTNYVEGTIAEALTNKYNYSTTEHKVGKWIDGKDLFEKTIVSTANATMADNEWRNIAFSGVPTGVDTMFARIQFNPADGGLIWDNRMRFRYNDGTIQGVSIQSGQVVYAGLVLVVQYTKSSS